MSFKRIRDPLYGFIQVDNDDLKLIDHKLVQRLRWVSQLPLEQLVQPFGQAFPVRTQPWRHAFSRDCCLESGSKLEETVQGSCQGA